MGYEIALDSTIYQGLRLKLYEPGSWSVIINWCAGQRKNDFLYLFSCLIHLLEDDMVDSLPFCSRRKPYFNDEKFSAWVAEHGRTKKADPPYIEFNEWEAHIRTLETWAKALDKQKKEG